MLKNKSHTNYSSTNIKKIIWLWQNYGENFRYKKSIINNKK